jgi:aspartyl-tRNA(Asn)/glutamyl-tRNA(Gln) amidotransferase subunit A
MSLRELTMALRARELSVVEHVTDVLRRLETDRFNAVIALDADRALARAAELDAELGRAGRCTAWRWA